MTLEGRAEPSDVGLELFDRGSVEGVNSGEVYRQNRDYGGEAVFWDLT